MAKKRRIPACAAKEILRASGVRMGQDPHALRSSERDIVLEVAKAAGYRKSKTSGSSMSRALLFYAYLDRKKGC